MATVVKSGATLELSGVEAMALLALLTEVDITADNKLAEALNSVWEALEDAGFSSMNGFVEMLTSIEDARVLEDHNG